MEKNLWLLPTDKPSRLYLSDYGKELNLGDYPLRNYITGQNIYITNDEEIKDCWVLNTNTNEVYFIEGYYGIQPIAKKIILTTDVKLIKDGVQAIDDEFLEWFVKNPSCEVVEIIKTAPIRPFGSLYKIIIPKEEPKQDEIMERFIANAKQQETLEEFSERLQEEIQYGASKSDIIDNLNKWQQEQDKNKYSLNDLKEAFAMGRTNATIKDFNTKFKNK